MKIIDLLNGDTSKLPSYSNPELMLIVGLKRHELHPTFIIAADNELAKRVVTEKDLEESKKLENYEIRRANELEKKQKRQEKNGPRAILLFAFALMLYLTLYFSFFGLIIHAVGITYIVNSNFTKGAKVFWSLVPIIPIFMIIILS